VGNDPDEAERRTYGVDQSIAEEREAAQRDVTHGWREAQRDIATLQRTTSAERAALRASKDQYKRQDIDLVGWPFEVFIVLTCLMVLIETVNADLVAYLLQIPESVHWAVAIIIAATVSAIVVALGESLRTLRMRQNRRAGAIVAVVALGSICVGYLWVTYYIRVVMASYAGDDLRLLPADLAAALLTAVAGGAMVLATVGSWYREGWERYKLRRQIAARNRSLLHNEYLLKRATEDYERGTRPLDEPPPPIGTLVGPVPSPTPEVPGAGALQKPVRPQTDDGGQAA
jgi:hypothetical protein